MLLPEAKEFLRLVYQGRLKRLVDRIQLLRDLGEQIDLRIHPIHHQGESPLEFGAQSFESVLERLLDVAKLLCLLAQFFDLFASHIERPGLKSNILPVGCIPRFERLLNVQEIVVPFVLAVVIGAKERHSRPRCGSFHHIDFAALQNWAPVAGRDTTRSARPDLRRCTPWSLDCKPVSRDLVGRFAAVRKIQHCRTGFLGRGSGQPCRNHAATKRFSVAFHKAVEGPFGP